MVSMLSAPTNFLPYATRPIQPASNPRQLLLTNYHFGRGFAWDIRPPSLDWPPPSLRHLRHSTFRPSPPSYILILIYSNYSPLFTFFSVCPRHHG